MSCYASIPNDIWSLGVILVNLTCGRNPWKRASIEDPTFRAYLKDPYFLKSILPLSNEMIYVLSRIFECDPAKRIPLPELRRLVLDCPRFTMTPVTPWVSHGPQTFDVVNPQAPASVPVQPLMAPHASNTSSDASSHYSDFSDVASVGTSLTEDCSDFDALSAVPSAAGFCPDKEDDKDATSPSNLDQVDFPPNPDDLVMPTLPMSFGSAVPVC